MRARRNSVFVRDPLSISGTLDRNQRARLMAYAESLERRTKRPGCPNGALGWVGLRLLKCLLYAFLGPRGCFPSYDQLQRASGMCRQSIANGIKRLERAGILRCVRRIVRVAVNGVVYVRQAANCYGFEMPSLPDERNPPKREQQLWLGKREQVEMPRPELRLGDLSSLMMRRLRVNQPDWRSAARAMSKK